MEIKKLSVLDLFCGAGGMSLGFKNAGFNVVHSVDNFQAAIDTYRKNLGEHIFSTDLFENTELPLTDVVIGGPPCQGFSSAGVRKNGDKRNSLVSIFSNIIVQNKPKAFVFENVEGFLTAENGERVFDLLMPLIEAGYNIHLRKINAAEYGVPQHRKRVIGIGGLGWNPSFPSPTHRPFGAPGSFHKHFSLPFTPSLFNALEGLGLPSSEHPGYPQGHVFKSLSELDLSRASLLKPGQKMSDLPITLRHESYNRRANRRVQDGTPSEKRGGAPTGVRRLKFEEPCKAITGGARHEFLHPNENRNLTLRECARIQTFPDDFVFLGSQADQMQLIGNAVPPLLAKVIAESLSSQLHDIPKYINTGEGKLLSFVPTDSNGYSPILKDVTRKITEIFNPEGSQTSLFF
jgi:DNA (cytosine-5)-methyltransferase 1